MNDAPDDDFAAASTEVARIFGLGDVVRPLVLAARGEQGVIWRLDTSRGSYAVKELVMRQREEDVAQDVAFQERAAERATSFEVARTVRTIDGRVLTSMDGRQLRVQTWLDMTGPDPGIPPQGVGQMLGELHVMGDSRTDPVDPWYTEPVGAARWQEYLDALATAHPEVAARLGEALPDQVAFEELLVDPVDLRTCHRDLWADNVRRTSSGGLCVFDWDNCGPASLDHELAVVLWEFGLDDTARVQSLWTAYVESGGQGRVRAAGDFTMLIAQFGHFFELAVAPFLDPHATAVDREHGWARLDEFESRPLTQDAITQILDVCC